MPEFFRSRASCFAVVLSVAGLFFFGGCAESTTVSYMRPAEINMVGRDVVVVDPIGGPGGDRITSRLKERLQGSNFTIVERRRALQMLGNETTLTGGQTRIVAAAAVVTGKVVRHDAPAQIEQVRYTSNGVQRVGYQGKVTATVEVAMDVVDLRTSENIATKSVRTSRQGKTDIAPQPPRVDPTNLFDQCYDDVVESIMRKIAVHQEQVVVRLAKVRDLPQNDAGNNSFKAGDYAAAAANFEAALEMAPSLPKLSSRDRAGLLHNCGLAYEWTHDFQTALDRYHEATQLSPDPVFTQSIVRCKQRIKEAEELQNQGA